MAYTSFKDFCVAAKLATAGQFDDWRKEYSQYGSAENGSAEKSPVDSFFECVREKSGKSEVDFLALVGHAFEWKTIDLLKLDLEGAEYDALLGFEESIKKGIIKIIQFEYGYINITTKEKPLKLMGGFLLFI